MLMQCRQFGRVITQCAPCTSVISNSVRSVWLTAHCAISASSSRSVSDDMLTDLRLNFKTNAKSKKSAPYGPSKRQTMREYDQKRESNRDRKRSGESLNATFMELMRIRRTEAKRSVHICTGRALSREELRGLYSQINFSSRGQVVRSFYCEDSYLMELDSDKSVQILMENGTKHFNRDIVPLRSRMLYSLRFTGSKHGEKSTKHDGSKAREIAEKLLSCDSISDQMWTLTSYSEQTEVGIRLRFFLAQLIEDMLKGLFPSVVCRPFGSSVNSFGTDKSDVDLNIVLEDEYANMHSSFKDSSRQSKANFLFRTKPQHSDVKSHKQSILHIISQMLKYWVPFVTSVTPILKARIPIVKFKHDGLNLQCDISAGNNLGCDAAALLWTLAEIDDRVRPLFFTIRHWSKELGISPVGHNTQTHLLSSFQCCCLVIHYLQMVEPPLLPPFNSLFEESRNPEEHPYSMFNIRKNWRSFSKQAAYNTDSQQDLLVGFFQYYARFDFKQHAINMQDGNCVMRAESDAAEILNPWDEGFNIVKHLNGSELHKFVKCCATAVDLLLQASAEQASTLRDRNHTVKWGLSLICEPTNYFIPNTAFNADNILADENEPDEKLLVSNLMEELDKMSPTSSTSLNVMQAITSTDNSVGSNSPEDKPGKISTVKTGG